MINNSNSCQKNKKAKEEPMICLKRKGIAEKLSLLSWVKEKQEKILPLTFKRKKKMMEDDQRDNTFILIHHRNGSSWDCSHMRTLPNQDSFLIKINTNIKIFCTRSRNIKKCIQDISRYFLTEKMCAVCDSSVCR